LNKYILLKVDLKNKNFYFMERSNNIELLPMGYIIRNEEDLKRVVPAAFSKTASPERTERYSYFSTEELLKSFKSIGWNPHFAKQNGSSPYSRHIIRLINPSIGFIPIKRDRVQPQIIVDNSHNGFTKAQIHLGLFRLICTNGLVAGVPGFSTNFKWLHMGVDQQEIIKMVEEIADTYNKIGSHVSDMQNVILSNDQKEEFAIRAINYRYPGKFINEDGTFNESSLTSYINIHDIYSPVRQEDNTNDLWTIFNTIQERTTKGMFETISLKRKSSPRPITNAKRNLEYNKKLWELAESFMPEKN